MIYADVNSSEAVIQWDVYPKRNRQGKEEFYYDELYTEIYYCPEGDDGEAYYVAGSDDKEVAEALAAGSFSFATDNQFDSKWTQNAYVLIKVTNGVNAVDIYSDENDITLSRSTITLSGKGIGSNDDGYFAEYTGSAIEPATAVKAYDPDTDKYISLKRDEDYTVSYENNTEVGYASVIVRGIGAYGGKNILTFAIEPRVLTGTPDEIPDMVYSANLDNGIKPYLRMADTNGKQLEYGKDFAVGFAIAGKPETECNKLSELFDKAPDNAVTVALNSKTASENKVKSPDKKETIGVLRNATKEERSNKKFTYVIEGQAAELVQNADVSEAIKLVEDGNKIGVEFYTVKVSKTKDGKIGSITFNAAKNSPYTGSRTIKFRYDKKGEE